MKIKKGDTVKIISGKDKGKSGKIMDVNLKDATLLVEGLNLFKKHVRPRKQGEKGQIVTLPRPLKISKVMLICPNCKKAARVGFRLEKDGKTKVRYCVKCKNQI